MIDPREKIKKGPIWIVTTEHAPQNSPKNLDFAFDLWVLIIY